MATSGFPSMTARGPPFHINLTKACLFLCLTSEINLFCTKRSVMDDYGEQKARNGPSSTLHASTRKENERCKRRYRTRNSMHTLLLYHKLSYPYLFLFSCHRRNPPQVSLAMHIPRIKSPNTGNCARNTSQALTSSHLLPVQVFRVNIKRLLIIPHQYLAIDPADLYIRIWLRAICS